MTPPTPYDLFTSNELDPVACLDSFGFNEQNKFDPGQLAAALASLGSFKDKKYRLKIRKEQVTLIHAVRFLLETLAAEQELGKRRNQEGESTLEEGYDNNLKVVGKRQKLCASRRAEYVRAKVEIEVKAVTRDLEGNACCSKLALEEHDIQAAMILNDMVKSRKME